MIEGIGAALFLLVILGYGVASGLYLASWNEAAERFRRGAFGTLGAAFGLHSLLGLLHIFSTGRMTLGAPDGSAVGGWDHAASTIAWFLVLATLGIGLRRPRLRVIGAFLGPIALGLCLTGLLEVGSLAVDAALPAAVDSAWFPIHTLANYAAIALFALASAVGGVYLMQDRRLRMKRLVRIRGRRLPSLEALDRLSHRTFTGGLVCLTAGIITGSLMVIGSGHEGLDLRPKVAITLVVWLVYVLGWNARLLAGWGGSRTAWIAIIGFAGLLVSVIGVAHA